MTEIRVALVDDHPVVLAGIAALLQSAPDISVVGSAATGADALALIEEHAPDLAVIDISLPDMSGVSLAQTILAKHPEIRIITLTVHESRAYVQSLLLAGVKGYVLKRAAADDLIRAVRAVAAGGVYLDPSVAEQALPTAAADRASSRAGSEELSPREEAVLKFTAQGFSNKEIAGRLEISIKSVETYKARAALKFDLRSRADIVRYGVSRGWLDAINIE
jgi:DNA-binding NarL/FixJ family response regulator